MSPQPDHKTRTRTEGPTPNGGSYSIAYFRDAMGSPCPRERAAGIEVIEYDQNGNAVFRTYMERLGSKDVPI